MLLTSVTETADRDTRASTPGFATAKTNRWLATGETRPLVLIVEDDRASARVLEAKLTTGGHRVVIAANSSDAQRLVLETPPDLVLTDIFMPGIDGIEFTRWLRAQAATAEVPIVLVTSTEDTQTLALGLAAGADDFLTKPVNSLELRTRVRSLLRTKALTYELRAREDQAISFASAGASEAQGVRIGDVPAASASQHTGGHEPRGASTILLVEDQKQERALLEVFLGQIGGTVRSAPDGRSALDLVDQAPPDLIVLDLMLPDTHGFELIRKLKGSEKSAQVPILVVSAMAEVQDRVRALELGADDFIVKGFDRIEFHARVQRLLRHKRWIDRLNNRCDEAMRQAVTDGLTGLATHGFLKETLQRELGGARRHGLPLALIFADIDHFKEVNETHGHAAGDRVLKDVAQTIRKCTRSFDTVARYGGEEFAILLSQTDRAGARILAERMRSAVEGMAIPLDDTAKSDRLRLTISLGVAGFPDDAADSESLLQHADEAMYAAKQAGRNSVVGFGDYGTVKPKDRTVLIVDDEEKNLRLLEAYLAPEGYATLNASNGDEALDAARRARPDLIVLDAMMPRLNGFDVCRRLKQEQATRLIPVVLVTALNGKEDRLRAIEAGADDFLSKPVSKVELLTRIRALLRAKQTIDLLEDSETVVFTLARAVEGRDPSTGGHVERVSHYAAELGKAIGLLDSQVDGLRRAGVVHDIGKIAVPDAILLKPGKLTLEERRIMERHVAVGYELLRPLRTFTESLPAVRFHHERLNGSGYPLGLKGEQVPLVAQIMAIVDVYDALTTDRVYRAALSQAEAVRIIRDEAARGLHDSRLVDSFVSLVMFPVETLEKSYDRSALANS
jgi:putative two-component system response regulator